MEFQYHGKKEEWSVTQGARRISAEEADRHVAEHPGRYPMMENPHERLRGLVARDVVAETDTSRFSMDIRYGLTSSIDKPTKEAYYRNVGWAGPIGGR